MRLIVRLKHSRSMTKTTTRTKQPVQNPEPILGGNTRLCLDGAGRGEGGLKETPSILIDTDRRCIPVDSNMYASLLQECATTKALTEGKQVHAHTVITGFENVCFLETKLVSMYANCGNFADARMVFDRMPKREIFSWNAMIRGYVMYGRYEDALALYNQLQGSGTRPDNFTFSFVLKACVGLAALREGKAIHGDLIRSGLELDTFLVCALIDMYAKCGTVEVARHVFDKSSQRNVVLWTAMIAGYSQNGQAEEALELFRQMQLAYLKPNAVTITSVLPACAYLSGLQQGKEIHGFIIRNEFEADVFVGSVLIDMYSKCGRMPFARQVFDKMSERNIVSWNAMVAAYAQTGNFDEALRLFHEMQCEGIKPNVITWSAVIAGYADNGHGNEALELFQKMQLTVVRPNAVTIVGVLQACACLTALEKGKECHNYVIRRGFESVMFIVNALIDMYAKCGNIESARHVFDKMAQRNVVSWTAMITGYGMHGYGEDALTLFCRMQESGMKPDHVTFIGVLSACIHAGLVDQGRHYFVSMSGDYGIPPTMKHYACMVDLLGRAGLLDEAYDFVRNMPLEPSAIVWGALLSACRIHCNVVLAECVAEHLFQLDPDNAGNYVLLSNIYAKSGMWDAVGKVRMTMKDQGLEKFPGCSWIEVKNRIHVFLQGDRLHPQSEKIYAILESLTGQMEAAGFVPETHVLLHDVDGE